MNALIGWNPRPKARDSSPTSGALIASSADDFNNNKTDKCNDNLQNSARSQDFSIDYEKETIKDLIYSICKYQKSYVKNSLSNLLEKSPKNAEIICKYITTEQNEINIKELTKEGKIKTLIDISKFLDFKDFEEMTKEDIFSYLNRFRKSEEDDPHHRWIGTWNNRHIVLLKFFRWLHDQDNPDIKNRKYPNCMQGIKRLRRKEVSRYKPSDLWTSSSFCPVL